MYRESIFKNKEDGVVDDDLCQMALPKSFNDRNEVMHSNYDDDHSLQICAGISLSMTA